MRGLFVMLACAGLGGCATGYSEFYQAVPDADATMAKRLSPAPEEPAVERATGDWRDSVDRLARRGYVLIGSSSFNSGRDEDDDAAVEQGQEIGADIVVIMTPQHTETRTTSIPITTPTSTTSHTTGSATAYGTGGTATAHGSSTTTTYGTQTTYIPMTVERYDFGAMYFVKVKMQFGAYFRDLNDAERSGLETNKGAAVVLIVDGSPAYNHDVLVGDIVLSVNGERVTGMQGMLDLIQRNAGHDADLTIIRSGKELLKTIPIGQL